MSHGNNGHRIDRCPLDAEGCHNRCLRGRAHNDNLLRAAPDIRSSEHSAKSGSPLQAGPEPATGFDRLSDPRPPRSRPCPWICLLRTCSQAAAGKEQIGRRNRYLKQEFISQTAEIAASRKEREKDSCRADSVIPALTGFIS